MTYDEDMARYAQRLRRELPRTTTLGLYAVRPNLNRRGVLTFHEVGKRGGVSYGRSCGHSARWLGLTILYATFHEAPAKARAAQTVKTPCASVCGNCTWGYQYGEQHHEALPRGFWRQGKYAPGEGFTLDGRRLLRAEFAFIQGTKFWVRNPVLEPENDR